MNTNSRIDRSQFLTAASAAAAFAALPIASTAQSLSKGSGMSRNIVLVHGAWADGSSWSKIIPLLQAAGHNVVAVQNEMSSLPGDSANTRAVIDSMKGPTVVVGHSYGGAVMTSAAAGADNVSALVYVAAYAPDEGETLGALGTKFAAPSGLQYVAPGPRGLLYIDRAHMPQAFAGDATPADAAVLAATQRPIAGQLFTDKMGTPAWKQHKSWYQVSNNDLMISPDLERFFAERIGAKTIALPSSHASLVAHPKEIAALILEACGA
jgi:pimeloyl-ACP methyl ester carboxylesterase